MSASVDAYPLSWPPGRPRTAVRQRSVFAKRTYHQAAKQLVRELELLGAHGVVVSSNLRINLSGVPYSKQATPADVGVAVYFTLRKRPTCFACDRWDRVEDNLRAIELSINALRGLERWGSSDMVDAAFTGFAALPAPASATPDWWEVLGVQPTASHGTVVTAYQKLRSKHHPDKGGDRDTFLRIRKAWDDYMSQ